MNSTADNTRNSPRGKVIFGGLAQGVVLHPVRPAAGSRQ